MLEKGSEEGEHRGMTTLPGRTPLTWDERTQGCRELHFLWEQVIKKKRIFQIIWSGFHYVRLWEKMDFVTDSAWTCYIPRWARTSSVLQEVL